MVDVNGQLNTKRRNSIFIIIILIFFSACGGDENSIAINKEYYANGVLKTEAKFVNGKKNGYYKAYYSDGNLQFITFYKNDIINGIFTHYDSITKKNNVVCYSLNGPNYGPYITFHKNGRIAYLKDFVGFSEDIYKSNQYNQYAFWDSTGKLWDKSYLYTKKYDGDYVVINFIGYWGKNKKAVISNFDVDFNVLPNQKSDSIDFKKATIIKIPRKLLDKYNTDKFIVYTYDNCRLEGKDTICELPIHISLAGCK